MKYNQLPQNGTGAPSGAPTHGALARDPGGQPGGRRWCFRTTLSCSASTGGVFERVHRDASEQKKRQGIYIYIYIMIPVKEIFFLNTSFFDVEVEDVCLFKILWFGWFLRLETHLEALNFFVRASPICSPGGEEECRQTRQRLRGASRVGPTPPRPWKWSQWSHFLETKNSSPRALLEPNDPHEKYSRLWEEELLGITPWID